LGGRNAGAGGQLLRIRRVTETKEKKTKERRRSKKALEERV